MKMHTEKGADSDFTWREWVPGLLFAAVLAATFLTKDEPLKFISSLSDAPAITGTVINSK